MENKINFYRSEYYGTPVQKLVQSYDWQPHPTLAITSNEPGPQKDELHTTPHPSDAIDSLTYAMFNGMKGASMVDAHKIKMALDSAWLNDSIHHEINADWSPIGTLQSTEIEPPTIERIEAFKKDLDARFPSNAKSAKQISLEFDLVWHRANYETIQIIDPESQFEYCKKYLHAKIEFDAYIMQLSFTNPV